MLRAHPRCAAGKPAGRAGMGVGVTWIPDLARTSGRRYRSDPIRFAQAEYRDRRARANQSEHADRAREPFGYREPSPNMAGRHRAFSAQRTAANRNGTQHFAKVEPTAKIEQ